MRLVLIYKRNQSPPEQTEGSGDLKLINLERKIQKNVQFLKIEPVSSLFALTPGSTL